ncbi:MAG: sensor histidine kinase [Alcanivoracaceae bacterium]|nr:sensor histidine kinase [Alcanivoracaceae bacterium]
MKKFRWLLVGLLLSCWPAFATIMPGPQDQELVIGRDLEVLEDPEGRWSLTDVRGSFADRFRPSERLFPGFGFTRSTIWLRFSVDFSRVQHQTWYLIQRHPIVDSVVLYSPRADGGYTELEMGDALPFSHRIMAHREFIFPLDSAANVPQTYYLKVSGKGALNLELKLSNAQGVIERTYREQLIFGLFFGGLFVMLVYNLLLYFSVRDVAYLYYVVFLGALELSLLNLNGFGLQYFWSEWPRINEHYPFFAYIGMAALIRYSLNFLDLIERLPRASRWLQWLYRVAVVMVPLTLIVPAPWSYHLNTLLVLAVVLSLFVIGSLSWLKGYTAARLYVAAWSVFLLGCVVFALDNLGIIPHTTLGNYAPHIGGGWVAVLLSLALGDRINLLEEQRDNLSRESEETMRRHVAEVQRLDRDKLVFLEYLSHELNTPLNWLGNARLLEAESMPRELRDAVLMVQRGQDRLQQLVATSLRYFDMAGRQQLPAHGFCQPMWMLDRLLTDCSATVKDKELKVLNRVPADLTVLACEHELREVLMMLLDNALRVSPQGGEVVLSAEVSGGEAVIRVCDQGRGIVRDNLEGIFQPFFMVGSGHHADGFGLSLPMARVMIRQMSGDLWAESAGPGKGACLCIRLPTEVV